MKLTISESEGLEVQVESNPDAPDPKKLKREISELKRKNAQLEAKNAELEIELEMLKNGIEDGQYVEIWERGCERMEDEEE